MCWNKKNKRWQAAINNQQRYLYLGSFQSEHEAADHFDRAAIKLRGRKARTNFPYERECCGCACGHKRVLAACWWLQSVGQQPGRVC